METLDHAWTILSGTPDLDLDLLLYVLVALGVAAVLTGDLERSSACRREILAIAEPRGERLQRAFAVWLGGLIAWHEGDLRRATAQVKECLRLHQAPGSEHGYMTALCLETIVAFGHFAGHHDACERQTRDVLGDTGFTEAFRHGQA